MKLVEAWLKASSEYPEQTRLHTVNMAHPYGSVPFDADASALNIRAKSKEMIIPHFSHQYRRRIAPHAARFSRLNWVVFTCIDDEAAWGGCGEWWRVVVVVVMESLGT